MSDPALLDQLAKLNAEVQNIESRFGQGQVPAATLEAIKCALDEVRLRLWGLLQSKSGESPETFAQRFRMRRTAELCNRLASDRKSGAIPVDHPDLPEMHRAAVDLASATEAS
jgi:hypothetical protein